MSPVPVAVLTVVPAAFFTVRAVVAGSEKRVAMTSSSFTPSALGESMAALWSSVHDAMEALSRGVTSVARTKPVMAVARMAPPRIRVPSAAGAPSLSIRRCVPTAMVRVGTPARSAAASAVAKSGAPAMATTSAAPGMT